MSHQKQEIGDFPGGLVAKTSPSNTRYVGSVPGQGAKSHMPLLWQKPKHKAESIL